MSKAWHEKNKMPKNPTLDQRIHWHAAHREHCGCRPVPKGLEGYLNQKPARKK